MELLCDQCSTKCLNLSRWLKRVRKIKKRKLYVREEKSDGESGGGERAQFQRIQVQELRLIQKFSQQIVQRNLFLVFINALTVN